MDPAHASPCGIHRHACGTTDLGVSLSLANRTEGRLFIQRDAETGFSLKSGNTPGAGYCGVRFNMTAARIRSVLMPELKPA